MKTLTLPNDMEFNYLNRGECDFLYEEIFRDEVYSGNGITLDNNEPGCIIDVGANIGMSILYFHHTYPNTKLFAIEPNPSIYQVLAANIETHDVNAKSFECALSDKPGVAQFSAYTGNSALSGLYADPDQDSAITKNYLLNEGLPEKEAGIMASRLFKENLFECQLRTLSDIIDENSITEIALLKIDVEKAEVDVLNGIKEAHWKTIKRIVMEVHSDDLLSQVESILSSKGFIYTVKQNALLEGSQLYDLYASVNKNT